MAAVTTDELDQKIDRILDAQSVLGRELAAQRAAFEAHVVDDAEMLVMVRAMNVALLGTVDGERPGIVGRVKALENAAVQRFSLISGVVLAVIASAGAVAAAAFK